MNGPAPAIEQAAAIVAGLGIFPVNLDRSPDRWATIQQHFGHLPWPLHRVVAVDASRDVDSVLAVRGMTLSAPPGGVGWNPYRQRMFALVEEACFASHLLAWRQFLELRIRARADPRGRRRALSGLRRGDAQIAVRLPADRHRQVRRHLSKRRPACHSGKRTRPGKAGALVAPMLRCGRLRADARRRPAADRKCRQALHTGR